MNTRLKTEWVRKLIKTKNFIVITDHDSVMNVRGVKPGLLNLYDLTVQRAHLQAFRSSLDKLIKKHDDLLSTPAKKVRKITVKKG